MKKLKTRNSEDKNSEDKIEDIVVGGALLGIVGLGVTGFGIRGLKNVINGKQTNDKGSENTNGIDERVYNVVNGAKKVVSFSGRMAAYSLLTLFGGVAILGGVAPVFYDAIKADKGAFKFYTKERFIEGAGVAIGTPLFALGLHGLIKTFQELRSVQKKETVSASTQTIEK